MKLAIIALASAMAATPAFADGEVGKLITAADTARLDSYETTRKAALDEARSGDPADLAVLDRLLARPVVSFSDADLTGDWRCRTIKAGGIATLVIYDWFRCKITDDGSGWMLDKTSGSQRTRGRLYDDGDKRAIYLGSLRYNDDPARDYAADPEMDQVGYAFRAGADEWRIEFPQPRRESLLDILELQR